MNKRQEKRLLNVAKALREAPHPERFGMETFVHDKYGENLNWCGSPSCALGHYGARTDLQKLMYIRQATKFSNPHLSFKNDRQGLFHLTNPDLLNHFGIRRFEAQELFEWYGCDRAKTPKTAALYIERFVARKKKEQNKAKAKTKTKVNVR